MNRLKFLREEKNLLQEELGKVIGVSGRSIGNYETGNRDMSTKIQKKLANFFNVSIDYLVGNSDDRKPSINSNLFLIPVLGKVPAGEPVIAEEHIESYLPIEPSMYNLTSPENLFFLKVQGESMNKVVPNGSYVLVRKQDCCDNNDVVVAIVNGDNEATLKRYKQIDETFVMLEPDSTFTEFTSRIINLKETEFKIIGKVIGDFKKWN